MVRAMLLLLVVAWVVVHWIWFVYLPRYLHSTYLHYIYLGGFVEVGR